MDLQEYQIGDRVTIFENGSLIDGTVLATLERKEQSIYRVKEMFTDKEYEVDEKQILIKAARPELKEIQVIRGAYILATYMIQEKEYTKSVKKTEYPNSDDVAQVDEETSQVIWDNGNWITDIEKRALLAYEKGEKNELTQDTEFMDYIAGRLDSDRKEDVAVDLEDETIELLITQGRQTGLTAHDYLVYVLCKYIVNYRFGKGGSDHEREREQS